MKFGTEALLMEAVDEFRLERVPGEGLRSLLVVHGNLSLPTEGIALEAQFRCSQGYLVITSDGNPYEEILHFYLIDSSGELMDDVSLGQIYHSGVLRDLQSSSDDTLEFSFYGTERWCLSILDRPRLKAPRLFSGVRYSKFGPHRLDLRKC